MDEAEIYRRQGFAGAVGIGRRVGLLVVDFQRAFADPDGLGGGNIAGAMAATAALLPEARARGWPVAHSRLVYAPGAGGAFARKAPGLLTLTPDNPATAFVAAVAPVEGECVVDKRQPSAFFGTELAGWLRWRGVDTLAVAGCVTSGCVRASVVDAMSHEFRVVCLADCVGDRALGPHEASLFDIGQKYADLMDAAALLAAAG